MDVLVIDSTDGEFGRHSRSQLRELGLDAEVEEVDFLDVPGVLQRSSADSFIVICDMAEDYSDPVVEKILEVEMEKGMIQKVFLDSTGQSQEIFSRKAQRKAGEAAEKLTDKIKE